MTVVVMRTLETGCRSVVPVETGLAETKKEEGEEMTAAAEEAVEVRFKARVRVVVRGEVVLSLLELVVKEVGAVVVEERLSDEAELDVALREAGFGVEVLLYALGIEVDDVFWSTDGDDEVTVTFTKPLLGRAGKLDGVDVVFWEAVMMPVEFAQLDVAAVATAAALPVIVR